MCEGIRTYVKRAPAATALAVATMMLVGMMVLSRGTEWRAWTYTLIALASLGFVAVAVAAGAHRTVYGRFMFVGLVGCCLGDLLGPYNFIWGSSAFLLAHLAFIAAFLAQGIRWKPCAMAFGAMAVVSVPISVWLLPHVPKPELWLVIPYITIISVMVAAAVGVDMKTGHILLVSGAILFFVSDIFVARWKYVAPDGINAYFCYPLYYSACVLLALSIAAPGHAATKVGRRNVA